MDKINKLYDIIERDFGTVICDNRANNGCYPNYKVEMKTFADDFLFYPYHRVVIYACENNEMIYNFNFYLNQKQIDELNSEEEENGINEEF